MSIRRHFLFLLLLLTSLTATAKGDDDVASARAKSQSYAFIENNGQITDQNNHPRTDIDFKIDLPGLTVFVGSGHLHYQWGKSDSVGASEQPATLSYRLDMILQGAKKNIVPQKEHPIAYSEHYYNKGEEITVAGFQKIVYPNIYPGIDWVVYCNANELKYDFIIHNNAHVNDIQLEYAGANKIIIEDKGLRITTPLGSIYENAPFCYETASHNPVQSRFTLHENIAGIAVGKYNGELIIDPVVDFATYYGDNNQDIGNAVAADKRGNTYLAGTTASTANIATTGAHQVLLQGQYDGFVVAFDLYGNRRWATYFGGIGTDNCYDAVCDPMGSIYVCGATSSTSAIATIGSQQSLFAGGTDDGFLIKFRRDGTREWGTYFGGPASDAVNNVTSDVLGNIFICGVTTSSTGISFNNPHQPNLGGLKDGFVARFTTLGQRQWSTYYGGVNDDAINFNACDLFGNLYIYGITHSNTGIATPGAHQVTINTTDSTTFLTKFNIAGTVQWGTYFGGTTSWAIPAGIICDASGDAYICGYTASSTGISAGTGQQLIKAAGVDGFISRFSSSGGQTWGSYLGNAGLDMFTGITINSKGRLFLSGITSSNTGMTTPDALQSSLNGAMDAHLSEWTLGGSMVYASYLGGNNDEYMPGGKYGSFIEHNFGKVYLCGTTASTAGLSTPSGYRPLFSGGTSDAFLASQIVDTICYIKADQFFDTLLCEGMAFNLPYDITLPFDPPNNFVAELSDASGSFAAPVVIGNVINNTGGSISCTIPFGTLPGLNYRIRLVSSSPVYTSVDNGVNIKIDNMPLIPSVSNASPACIGDTLKMSVINPQTGVKYLWDGPGYTGFAVSVSFNKASLAIVGLYTITPIAGACTGTAAPTNVNVKPTPAITAKGSNTPICEGETLFLNASSDSAKSTFKWTGPGFNSAQQNPSITHTTSAASGIYTVAATLNGCTSKKDSLIIDIKHKPVLTTFSNSPVCETDTLKMSATDSDVQTQYSWAGPAGFASITADNTISSINMDAAGRYIIMADNDGCTTIDTIDVTVKPMPLPVATNNSPICSGERLELHVASQHPTTKFNWYGPDDFNKTEQAPVIEQARYIANGIYRVIANLDGCVQEDTTNVKVTQAPTTVITTNSPVYNTRQLEIYASNNLNNATYLWTGPNNYQTNEQNILINNVTKLQSGYYVLKTQYENCSAIDSVEVEVLDFLGYSIFILYPSPNNGEFTIQGVVMKDTEIPISISDMAGHVLYTDKLRTLNRQLDRKIEIGGRLASGVYILSIRAEGKIIQKRFTVIR